MVSCLFLQNFNDIRGYQRGSWINSHHKSSLFRQKLSDCYFWSRAQLCAGWKVIGSSHRAKVYYLSTFFRSQHHRCKWKDLILRFPNLEGISSKMNFSWFQSGRWCKILNTVCISWGSMKLSMDGTESNASQAFKNQFQPFQKSMYYEMWAEAGGKCQHLADL